MKQGQDMAEMPKYRCYKEVHALKIAKIVLDSDISNNCETDCSTMLIPENKRYSPFKVEHEYMRKHKPQVGGYYVVYKDGYKSFSPSKAFEEGYTEID